MPSLDDPDRDRTHWTTWLGEAAAHPAAFAVVLIYALAWIIFDSVRFDFNALAPPAFGLLPVSIPPPTRRDPPPINKRRKELLRREKNARAELTRLDEK